jgi:glycosyltransferase involved in cell wall biosynthesis
MSKLKLLCLDPGSRWSTWDLYDGYTRAWQAQGHEVIPYLLDRRIVAAGRWLNYQWRLTGRQSVRPTSNDVCYLASFESVIQALAHDVDWVINFSCLQFHPGVFHAIRKAGVKCAALLTESPYQDREQVYWASMANVAFTNERTSVEPLRHHNADVYYLPHAYDPERHHPGMNGLDAPAHDAVFVGTAWPERVDLFSHVNWDGIDLGLYGLWKRLPSRHRLRQYVRGPMVDNAVTAALYRHAKVGLNPYRQSVRLNGTEGCVTTGESINPRAVELAACGCFSIADQRAEATEMFGDLVPSYSTPQELEEVIRFYLAHPEERDAKAAQLPAAVQGRTFDALGRQIINTLEAYSG